MASSYTSALTAARYSYSPSPYPLKNDQQQQRQNFALRTRRVAMVVKAEGGINPSIRKEEPKVVDSIQVSELSKPLTPYCRDQNEKFENVQFACSIANNFKPWGCIYRCWRSGTFPLCDGSHVKHNKETGDNVGPLLVKK